MATDNVIVERAIYKGNSSSEKLFDLVLRFKKLEIIYGCSILVTHVAGTRMILQGTDGISRGDLYQGVSVGEEILNHCPWGKTALQADPKLLNKVRSWSSTTLTRLQPRDWFEFGHDIQAWRL